MMITSHSGGLLSKDLVKDEPVSVRRQLQYVKQFDGETLEEFAERVHFLVMDGYDRCENAVIDQI